MENQYNNISQKLISYRKEIDEIDQKILDLLGDRMKIVKKVGEHKEDIKDRFFIRSNREADMIKNLVKKSDKNIPKSIIISIWRRIISSANILEQNIKIALHNPKNLPGYNFAAKDYYGDLMPISNYNSSTKVISELECGNCQIGIFSIPKIDNSESDHWWINISNNKSDLKVFAKIPFVEYEENKDDDVLDDLFTVAIKSPEKSQSDKTLLVLEIADDLFSNYNLEKALLSLDLEFVINKTVKLNSIRNITFCLIAIDGFVIQEDEVIKLLSKTNIKPFVKVIGHYSTPIKI